MVSAQNRVFLASTCLNLKTIGGGLPVLAVSERPSNGTCPLLVAAKAKGPQGAGVL
jgi:hypothetical protein